MLLIIPIIYVALCAGLYFKQRSFIYHPTPASTSDQNSTITLTVDGADLKVSTRQIKSEAALIYFGGNAENVAYNLPLLIVPLFLRKLVLGIPAQASGKNHAATQCLRRPSRPATLATSLCDVAAQMTRRDVVMLCNFTLRLRHGREIAQPYRFWGLLGFPPRSDSQAFPSHAIYLLHYRGYSGSSGTATEQALHEDANKVYEYVKARHSKITLIGRSLGTGVATRLASEQKIDKLGSVDN